MPTDQSYANALAKDLTGTCLGIVVGYPDDQGRTHYQARCVREAGCGWRSGWTLDSGLADRWVDAHELASNRSNGLSNPSNERERERSYRP